MTTAAVGADPGIPRMHDLARFGGGLERRNLAYLAGCWAVVGASATVAIRRPRWWTIVGAAAVISGRQHALLNIEHECMHNMFVRGGKRRNDRIGRWSCAGPCGSPYGVAKATHLRHHRLLAAPDDPDRHLHAGPDKQTRRGVRRYFASALSGRYAWWVLTGRDAGDDRDDRDDRDDEGLAGAAASGTDRRDLAAIGAAQLALAGGAVAAGAWWAYPVLWAAPLATLTSSLHLVRSFVEHAVTDDELADHDDRLITTVSNPIERSFLAPFNMNHHAEHHLYPFVPSPRLPEVRRRLRGTAVGRAMLVRRSYLGALRTHLRSLPDG